jgi:hypothetical protein
MSEREKSRGLEAQREEAPEAKLAEGAPAMVEEVRGGGRAARGLSKDQPAAAATTLGAGNEGPLPFKAEMEASFGVDLSGVKARFGDGALGGIGARAASEGDVIAFSSQAPEKEEVAEEVAHWVQRHKHGDANVTKAVDGGKADAAEGEAQRVAPQAAAGAQVDVQEAPTARVHRAADDPVVLAPTYDLNHPWLVASGITDLGPYQFMPAQTKFVVSPQPSFKSSSDNAKAWAALLKTTTYEPEKATWKPRGDLIGKPTLEKDGKFDLGAAQDAVVEARAGKARAWVSQNNLKWAEAMVSYKDGAEPKLAAITDHEGVGGEGHTVERHVLGTGKIKSERDLARRAAFNEFFPAEGKASVFKDTAAADTAAKAIHGAMSASWLSLRNTILALKDKVGGAGHEMTGAKPANVVALEREAGVKDTDPQPAYLGLGVGVRPLFAEDVNSNEWKTWAALNTVTADPTHPLTKSFTPAKTTAFVRPTESLVTGGWFFKTVFPDG